MSDTAPDAPVEHTHHEYDTDVPDAALLEPDFDAEEADEVDEVVEDDDTEGDV